LEHFTVTPHFFCQATPGAGKTRMAAEMASRLIEQDRIDLVLCFAPSCQVVEGFRSTFAEVLGRRLDGQIGAVGAAYTYQAMEYRDEGFWQLLDDYRVFVVFDEIHHCAGHDPLLSNAWGQQILHRIQDRAAFTLALSGTPWRSDDKAIALARYSSPEGHLICDYRYGLKEAVADGVCRSPRIVLLDNQKVKLTEELGADSSVRLFPSIAKLLGESPVTYEELLRHDEVINPILDLGCSKLSELRHIKPDAAGLVVATDIDLTTIMFGTLLDTGITGISADHVFLAMQQLVDLGNVRHVGGSAYYAVHQTRLVIHTDVRLQSGKAGVLPLLPPLRTVLESHPSYGSSLPAA